MLQPYLPLDLQSCVAILSTKMEIPSCGAKTVTTTGAWNVHNLWIHNTTARHLTSLSWKNGKLDRVNKPKKAYIVIYFNNKFDAEKCISRHRWPHIVGKEKLQKLDCGILPGALFSRLAIFISILSTFFSSFAIASSFSTMYIVYL